MLLEVVVVSHQKSIINGKSMYMIDGIRVEQDDKIVAGQNASEIAPHCIRKKSEKLSLLLKALIGYQVYLRNNDEARKCLPWPPQRYASLSLRS